MPVTGDVAEVQIDDTPCMDGDMIVPLSGAWTAQLTAFGPDGVKNRFSPGQRVTVTVHGVRREGTVVLGGAPDLTNVLRVVGGTDGLDRVLEPTDYRGRDLAYVVADVLEDAGETPGNLEQLRGVYLAHWTRAAERARLSLRRLMRMAPGGVVLRVSQDGSWAAVKPSWAVVGGALDGMRDDSYPSEDVIKLYVGDGVAPEPGTSINIFGAPQRVDRVQYEWQRSEGKLRALVWIRDAASTETLDRQLLSIRDVVERLLVESRTFDYGRLYQGSIAVDGGADGQVDVNVIDDLRRVKSVSGARLLTVVGSTAAVRRGSRVAVGWLGGDPRYPFALLGGWGGDGGLTSWEVPASSIALGAAASSCDQVATRQDLLDLMQAISGAGVVQGDGGATLKANILAALGPLGLKWGLPGFPGSTVVKAKR